MSDTYAKCKTLKEASRKLASFSGQKKNDCLKAVQKALALHQPYILKANAEDIKQAEAAGTASGYIDRLTLTPKRFEGMLSAIDVVLNSVDPIGISRSAWTLGNGLRIQKVSVPMGVIAIIYESRPNVTIDAFALAFKAGSGILLRGSTSALASNKAIVASICEGLEHAGVSSDVVCLIEEPSREVVGQLLRYRDCIDLVIPRGGGGLIQFVTQNSKIPVIETGLGNCHLYIDASANLEMALDILENAKLQRVSVCNACETLLVHEAVAEVFLKKMSARLASKVEFRACERTRLYIEAKPATESDFQEEFCDAILAVKVVSTFEEAVAHINQYGTMHSEAIVTEDYSRALAFTNDIDAACVYVNASTRFTDGGEFGFGAEMGVSTQKMHIRGPIGLEALVSEKYIIFGNGQTRPD
ncbi:MAG: glutamate-5-semialdehyde dehydrogenase [Proteobacteria bacterium]|nr:glutamate-5-semialdehyde dehydrogenase [Cystobacterineae bacterium]MCL2259103.1 glutamate-5-semialdehyde dehydrogenase [Cystobacterineae bacterium]MCL2314505.1 glutamate-5-semialdehyde dehydrogenase [Pseudomonadota bacterium]